MKFDEYYSQLNPEQKKAVDTIEGPVLVIAGPGTGKTQTIALRIGKILLDTQVDPQNILCLTFTDTAVSAMRNRLLELIGKEAYAVRIYTFHSFCNEVIQSNLERFGQLGANAESITDVEKLDILSGIINELEFDSPLKPFGNPELYIKEISGLISELKRESVPVKHLRKLTATDSKYFLGISDKVSELKSINYRKLTDELFAEFVSYLADYDSDHGFTKYITQLFRNHLATEFEDDKLESKARTGLRKTIIELYKKYSDPANGSRLEELANIYESYQNELVSKKVYDYEDMIRYVVEAFQEDEELLKIYQEKYQYILVDEYQDTNNSQNSTLKLLGGFFDSPNIFVVGDDDQAIYRFQGASLENIVYFNQLYENDLNVVVLKNNYRSHQHILDASYSLINNNSNLIKDHIDGVDKQLKSKASIEEGSIELHSFTTESEENLFMVEEIASLISSGVKPEEIAVLYRENKDVNDIADSLERKAIPFSLVRGQNIFRDNIIQQFIKLVRFIVNPVEDYDLFHILNFEFLNVSSLDLVKLLRYCYQNRLNIGDVIYDSDTLSTLDLDSFDNLQLFASNIKNWQKRSHNEDFVILFNDLIRESGLLNYILAHENKYELLLKLTRLYDEIKHLDQSNDDYLAKDFIEHLDLVDEYGLEVNIKPINKDPNSIQLMTAHSAKGLEFEYVFIVRAVDKKWGNRAPRGKIKLPMGITTLLSSTESNEEERRLFYVAMTRAKSKIYMLYSQKNANDKEQSPSQFIAETDDMYVKKVEHSQEEEKHMDAMMLAFNAKPELEMSTQGEAYLKEILKDYKLSVTHISSYKRCPRCFLYNTLLKVPKLKNKNAAYGTAVHNALKTLLVTYNKTSKLPELNFLLKLYEENLFKEHLSDKDMQDALQNGRLILSNYYDSKADKFPKNSLLETSFSRHNVYVDDIQIIGNIDRIDILEGKKVRVLDYKTGNPDYKSAELNQEKLGDYYLQLVFYKLLIEESPLLNYQVESAAIEFVEQSKRKNEYITKEYEIPDSDVVKLKEEIVDVYNKIQNLEFEECNETDCYTPELHDIQFTI